MKPHKPLRHHLYDYFFPHERNGYRPHFFAPASVAIIALLVIILQAGYVFDTTVVSKSENFLASVLPGSLIALTNSDRAANSDSTLSENPVLDKAAELAAEDMASKGYFAHVSPSGTTPWDWLAQAGYQYSYAGENLAVNFTDSADVEKAWMASPTHHANIVKPQYTEIGVGTADGMYQGQQVTFVVQFFGTPATESPAAPAESAPIAPEVAVATPPPPAASAGSAAAAPAADEAATGTPTILGTEAAPAAPVTTLPAVSPAPNFYNRIIASPSHALSTIATVLLAILGVLALIAFVAGERIPHRHVVVGTLFLLIVIASSLELVARLELPVQLPTDAQAASVEASL